MITFQIRLKSIADFWKYIGLFDKWKISGYIRGKNFQVEACDILEIFQHYQPEYLQLILTGYNTKDVADIADYLVETGLLVSDN